MIQQIFSKITDNLSIVISGQAGQGIETMTAVLTKIFKESGYYTFACQEFMSRVRGGTNSATIRVSSKPVKAYVQKIDILVALHPSALPHLEKRMAEGTVVVGEVEKMLSVETQNFASLQNVPFSKMAVELGNPLLQNTIAAAVILAILKIDLEPLNVYLEKQFGRKGAEIVEKNKDAALRGYEIGVGLRQSADPPLPPLGTGGAIPHSTPTGFGSTLSDEILINGSEAVGLGAIAGGCNFVASYPMSPSTAVFSFLCQKAHEFNIVAEQAEDEIAAINMGIGAWYAGARAMTTTSGGGFALMTEGVSLAGMIESPMVIYLAQRPGPATGVPTRTEQGDLELVLYAGHGEFSRIILAPGNAEQAFYLTQKAFNLADKYQCPVFILSDQYLADSVAMMPAFDVSKTVIESNIVQTDKDYKRYILTENGISPRGIPGFGEGVLCAGSDEHDEEGHNTENLDLHVKMVGKRKKKAALIAEDVIEPELVGSFDYTTLMIGWGSTYEIIKEALERVNLPNLAFLHFSQVYPLPKSTADYLKKAKKLVMIENNTNGQLARLIKRELGIEMDKVILHYDGLPMSVEQIMNELANL